MSEGIVHLQGRLISEGIVHLQGRLMSIMNAFCLLLHFLQKG